jgi:transcriptional regulator with XRE-family HTH domain
VWDAKRIRELREALGMSQDDFAKAAGVANFVSISRWERGETRPRVRAILDRLDALAEGVAR